ncbi:hypothetical protein I302_103426 [Kwoniella bestiolae CBS 10118]|uniref:Uncharacterized protein n=1 Tax=Kwoniella bestiolae CBS 10118 TaxID=1296100 RepID=A0AAJ8K609_9TREE
MSQYRQNNGHPYGARPPYNPPPAPVYSHASMNMEESSGFPEAPQSQPQSRNQPHSRIQPPLQGPPRSRSRSGFQPQPQPQHQAQPPRSNYFQSSRPVGGLFDSNNDDFQDPEGHSGFPSAPAIEENRGHPPPSQGRSRAQPPQEQARRQPLSRSQSFGQGRAQPSATAQNGNHDRGGTSSAFQAHHTPQPSAHPPLKSALKRPRVSSPEEEALDIKPSSRDHSGQVERPNTNRRRSNSNGAASYFHPPGSDLLQDQDQRPRDGYHQEETTPSRDPRRLRRQQSMPHLARAAYGEEEVHESIRSDYSSPRSEQVFHHDTPINHQPTIAASVEMGRGRSVINERSTSRMSNQPPTHPRPQAQPLHQYSRHNLEASEEQPEMQSFSGDQEFIGIPPPTQDPYAQLRAREEGYRRAISLRDKEIETLRGVESHLKGEVAKAKSANARSTGKFREYVRGLDSRSVSQAGINVKLDGADPLSESFRLKQEALNREEMDTCARDKNDALTRSFNEAVEDMKNFRESGIAPINAALKDSSSSIARIRETLNELKNETGKLDTAEKEIKRLNSVSSDQKSTIDKLQAKISYYEENIAPTLQKLDANFHKGKEEDGPSSKLTELMERIIKAEKDLMKAHTDLEKSQNTSETYEKIIEECVDLLDQRGCEGHDPKEMLTQLDKKHKEQIKEVEATYTKKLEDLDHRFKAAVKMVETLERDSEEHDKQMEAQQSLLDERDQLLNKVSEFKDKVKQMEATIKEVQTEKGQGEEKTNDLLIQLQEAQNKLREKVSTISQLQEKKASTEAKELQQLRDDLKANIERIPQITTIGGSTTANTKDSDVAKLQDELKSCQKKLEDTQAELAVLKAQPAEDEDAGIARFIAGKVSRSEMKLVQWAEENIRSDFKPIERDYKNDVKRLTVQVEKLKKDLEAKSSEIDMKDRQIKEMSKTQGASLPQVRREGPSGQSESVQDQPTSGLPPSSAPPTAKLSGTGGTVDRSSNSKKRRMEVPPDSDDEMSLPPLSQKRRKAVTDLEEEELWNQFSDPEILDDVNLPLTTSGNGNKGKAKERNNVDLKKAAITKSNLVNNNDSTSTVLTDLEMDTIDTPAQIPPSSQVPGSSSRARGRGRTPKASSSHDNITKGKTGSITGSITVNTKSQKASAVKCKSGKDDDDYEPAGGKKSEKKKVKS